MDLFHTNAFLFGFIFGAIENALIDLHPHYRFHTVFTVHTKTLKMLHCVCDIPKFCLHSPCTTICETKLLHQALVRPVQTQNLLGFRSGITYKVMPFNITILLKNLIIFKKNNIIYITLISHCTLLISANRISLLWFTNDKALWHCIKFCLSRSEFF